jgi:hypothetical protein
MDGGDGDGDGSSLKVITFNTGGSASGTNNDGDNFNDTQAGYSDEFYGNGLAWGEAVTAVTDFLAVESPEVIGFQEIFHSPECESIPANAQTGFVCETWSPGDPTVANVILGSGYQVACNLGKPDKCIGVKTSFATIDGCSGDFCLDGLDGASVPDCGGGSRVGRATLTLAAGGSLTVVLYHGTSGFTGSDADCRIAQTEQVFVSLDGQGGPPAANGQRNIVLGDLNTDPYRAFIADSSARRWRDFVGRPGDQDVDYFFISDVGLDSTPTYAGSLTIDHVISDAYVGNCRAPGTDGEPPVYPYAYFDHVPIVCELSLP